MSALTRHTDSAFRALDWEPEVTQLLDEHHLVAWSSVARRRVQFATCLTHFLSLQPDTEICTLYGRFITDLDSFCHQIERVIPAPSIKRQIDGSDGLVSLLRSRHSLRVRRASRFRYYVWNDADVLLKRDHRLFGRIVDAIAGVAAEAEYASDELLLVQRAVFVGGPMLDLYAENSTGQFRAWYDDGLGEPFWQMVTGIQAPPMLRYQVDLLGQG
ncbi:MAG TPA: hypothetical protein VFF69_11890 [Phycisphaerales bacterium]|nr:hypothetical protein [Phycisphaerales bacterium]